VQQEPTRPASRQPIPVVIDTDPGIDDMLALYLSLYSPELDVRGISVSYGNTVVENAYRNAVEILRRGGKRARLAVGARRPLARPLVVADETHGPSGLGYAAVPPAGVILDFVRPLERLLEEQADRITLVTLGPLTSLALALRRDPDLVRAKVARHIAMVGTLGAKGNTTPLSEFNAWCDPEALHTVLQAELPTELVGLDVTRQFVLDSSDVARLGRTGVPFARWLHEALRFYVEFHRKHEGLDGCVINDVLPIAALIRPQTVTFKPMRIAVDLADDERRGRTCIAPDGASVRVATDVNIPEIRTLLSERVFRRAATPLPAPAARAPIMEAHA
jgi:pyrimidine-specific ribonucleoside hydrolase